MIADAPTPDQQILFNPAKTTATFLGRFYEKTTIPSMDEVFFCPFTALELQGLKERRVDALHEGQEYARQHARSAHSQGYCLFWGAYSLEERRRPDDKRGYFLVPIIDVDRIPSAFHVSSWKGLDEDMAEESRQSLTGSLADLRRIGNPAWPYAVSRDIYFIWFEKVNDKDTFLFLEQAGLLEGTACLSEYVWNEYAKKGYLELFWD
jgi:hypothetical protein